MSPQTVWNCLNRSSGSDSYTATRSRNYFLVRMWCVYCSWTNKHLACVHFSFHFQMSGFVVGTHVPNERTMKWVKCFHTWQEWCQNYANKAFCVFLKEMFPLFALSCGWTWRFDISDITCAMMVLEKLPLLYIFRLLFRCKTILKHKMVISSQKREVWAPAEMWIVLPHVKCCFDVLWKEEEEYSLTEIIQCLFRKQNQPWMPISSFPVALYLLWGPLQLVFCL